MADAIFPWSYQGQQRSTTVRISVPANASPNAPVVILLHGTSGDINDMGDPAVHPRQNVERLIDGTRRDRGWHPYPNVGWWDIGVDSTLAVGGWESFLNGRGLPTVNYSQAAPRGALAETVTELRALIDALELERTSNRFPAFASIARRPIVLIGHSRGGILVRQLLVDLRDTGSAALARIPACVTLHAPNQGSNLANVAIAVDAAAVLWRRKIDALPMTPAQKQLAFGKIIQLTSWLHEEAGALAYQEYRVGAPLLDRLRASEPVPGVTYFTFGGTRPTLFNIRKWAFTPDSATPQLHNPPFHWTTVYQTIMPVPGPISPLPELRMGFGDVLVAAAATKLPFAVHQENPINHAEALWDSAVKSQIASVLDRLPVVTPVSIDDLTMRVETADLSTPTNIRVGSAA